MAEQGPSGSANDFGAIADVYDQLVSWAPYDQWVRQLAARLERYGLKQGDLILDAACGTGLSTAPWLEKGFRLVATDRSARMLELARARLRGYRRRVRFVRRDLTSLDLPEQFDIAICMHSGLDYILDLDELVQAFRSLRGQIKTGGLFAFDKCLDEPEFYRDAYADSRRIPAGIATFEYSWDAERRLFEQRCKVLRDGTVGGGTLTEVVFHMLAVPVEELVGMVQKAGFEMLEPPRQFTVPDPGMGIFRAV